MHYKLKGSSCPHCIKKLDIEFEADENGKLLSEKITKTANEKKEAKNARRTKGEIADRSNVQD